MTELYKGFVLHTRPYRETSLLVEILTREQGIVSLVARGAKRGKKPISRILQPFSPILFGWFGKGELVTLTSIENIGASLFLQGKKMICGLYMNELLIKLLHRWDPHEDLYDIYEMSLVSLRADNCEQTILRIFEKNILKSIGYSIVFDNLDSEKHYKYDPAKGPIESKQSLNTFSGKMLIALKNDQLEQQFLRDIKRLMRLVLSYHLGNKTIKTRELL